MQKETGFNLFHFKNPDNPGMTVHTESGVTWLSFPGLDRMTWITNAFSTRLGGVSQGDLSSMNLSFSRGDDPENVLENYRRISGVLGFKPEDIIASDQTHTTNVIRVTEEDAGKGVTRPKVWRDVDGMITDTPGIVLATYYADCVPLYFVDPINRAIGLSHSGWRGTAAHMGEVTVNAMHDAFGSNPVDMYAAIGPCICRDCYEVSEDVAERFSPSVSIRKPYGKYLLDLPKANFNILKQAGIPASHIFSSGLCTSCNSSLLFSHRASEGRRGNLTAFLTIKPAV